MSALADPQTDAHRHAPAPAVLFKPDRPDISAALDKLWEVYPRWIDARSAGQTAAMEAEAKELAHLLDGYTGDFTARYGSHSREIGLFLSETVFFREAAYGRIDALLAAVRAADIERLFSARTEFFRTYAVGDGPKGHEGRDINALHWLMAYTLGLARLARAEGDRATSFQSMAAGFEGAQYALIGEASQAVTARLRAEQGLNTTLRRHENAMLTRIDPLRRMSAPLEPFDVFEQHLTRDQIRAERRFGGYLDQVDGTSAELDASRAFTEALLAEDAARGFDLGDLIFPQPVPLTVVMDTLGPGEALMMFVRDKVRYSVIIVSADVADFWRSESSPAEVADMAKALRAGMKSTQLRAAAPLDSADDDVQMLELAHTLFSELLEPGYEAYLSDIDKVHVVASDALAGLPFEMLLSAPAKEGLPMENHDWLVKRHAFQVLPSVELLLEPERPQSDAPPEYLGVGDPDYVSLLGEPGVDATMMPYAMTALPETAAEVRDVSAAFAAPRLLTGATANELELSKALQIVTGAPGVVHFATHGVAAGELTRNNAAFLAMTPYLPPDTGPISLGYWDGIYPDGVLYDYEIRTLRMNADLVILSACNSVVDPDPLAGYGGLSAAFLWAGARRVMGSHWPVNSRAAVEIVTGMAARDPQFRDPAQALRGAVLEVMAQGGAKAHPAYWAPFSLIGAP